MKKINLLVAILIALTTITSCNNKEKLTPSEILVQNGPWGIDHLELLNVVNTGNLDFNEQEFLAEMNTELATGDIIKLTFNQDGTGGIIYLNRDTNEIEDQISWTWEVTTANELKTQREGYEPEIYKNLVVTETRLEFMVIEDANLATNVTGDVKYVCVPKLN